MKGVASGKLPEILDEYMYRYRMGHSNGDILTNYFWMLESMDQSVYESMTEEVKFFLSKSNIYVR